MELPHLPRNKGWQRRLKRDGQHPYVGTVGTLGVVLWPMELKVEKIFLMHLWYAHMLPCWQETEVKSSGLGGHQQHYYLALIQLQELRGAD